MCLAIYKPGSIVIPEAYLKEGWDSNPDGAGFAFVSTATKRVVVHKGFMKRKEFLDAYANVSGDNPKAPFLIHFRIRTMGWKNGENTHPFPIAGGVLIHNGGFSGTDAMYDTGPSDTALFAKKYGPYMTYDRVNKHKSEWEKAIGYNKVALLYDDGRHIILNNPGWTECEGAWYSNNSFRPRARGGQQTWPSSRTGDLLGNGLPTFGGYAEPQPGMMH
jgi:hypothetical protein